MFSINGVSGLRMSLALPLYVSSGGLILWPEFMAQHLKIIFPDSNKHDQNFGECKQCSKTMSPENRLKVKIMDLLPLLRF